MQDGIGSQYTGKDRASEDHININGEVFKLDRTKVFFEIDEDELAERSAMDKLWDEDRGLVYLKTISD